MATVSECGKGWANRCAASKGKRCACRCGGANHGKDHNGRGKHFPEVETLELTDHRVFDGSLHFGEDGAPIDWRYFLSGAEKVADIEIWRDGGTARASIPHRFVAHSPTGFEYGYGGSGPADLALNIVALFVPPPQAYRLHQRFKWAIVAKLHPDHDHVIHAAHVREWISAEWAAQAGAAS